MKTLPGLSLSLSSNFRTSLSYFEQASFTQSLLCGECRENFGRNVLWLCLLWGSEEGAYTLHWQGSQAARWDQAQDGPGTPPTFHNNLPGSLSSSLYFSFLLTLFLCPPHSISLSSLLFFCLTLAKFLVLRRRVTRQQLTRKGQEGKDSS